MTTIFPMAKASLGLSISRDSICLVEIRRNWNGVTCRHISERLLPPKLLRLSPARPNIGDMKEFAQCLSTLVKRMNLPQSVALSLPDLCGRTTVLTFSTFPSKKAERDSIVAWRFQQEMNIATDKTRLAYRIFTSSKQPSESIQVLATAVQHTIIEQYEEACLEVGLLPISVGLAGLDVFDFYRSHIQEISRGPKQRTYEMAQECLFLYLANWGLSFMAFRNGHPTFVRVKALPIPRLGQEDNHVEEANESPLVEPSDSHDEQDGPYQNHEQYSSLEINNVANELVATLQYYFETLQVERDESNPIPLYFAEGLRNGESLLPTEHMIKSMLKASMSHQPPLTMINFSNMLPPKINKMIMDSPLQMASLSAVASVMVL